MWEGCDDERPGPGHLRDRVTELIPLQGANLDRVLDLTHPFWRDDLDRNAYGRWRAAQTKTAWGLRSQRSVALVEGANLLASAEQYDLAGRLDGRPVRICGIGSVFTDPAHPGPGHARVLLEALLDRAARGGATMALLFPRPGLDDDARQGFDAIPVTDATIHVAASSRRGAPMTMVRGGEERDLAAIVAMGRVRADAFRLHGGRFHLDRDIDLVQYAITRKRLLAGLGPAGARQLHFFIAEEGTTAAAYVVLSIAGDAWTLEECGDRDPSGARVGALLQALIAREPVERRPTIRGWLPPRFLPPQVTVVPAAPSMEIVMARLLDSTAMPRLTGDEVLYWRNDAF
jgi:GNAT superfamily N-acetyltransferase